MDRIIRSFEDSNSSFDRVAVEHVAQQFDPSLDFLAARQEVARFFQRARSVGMNGCVQATSNRSPGRGFSFGFEDTILART